MEVTNFVNDKSQNVVSNVIGWVVDKPFFPDACWNIGRLSCANAQYTIPGSFGFSPEVYWSIRSRRPCAEAAVMVGILVNVSRVMWVEARRQTFPINVSFLHKSWQVYFLNIKLTMVLRSIDDGRS